MSASRAGLIDAMLASQDDAPRLVFADCLTDEAARLSGPEAEALQARAELIRVQCQLARLAEDAPSRAELAALEHRLLETHGAAWAARLGHPVAGYHRGVAFLGELTPPALRQLPADLFEREPVAIDLDVRSRQFGSEDLEQALPDVEALAASPRLRAVRAITTLQSRSLRHPDQGYFARLLGSSHLGNLKSVNLFELIVGPEGVYTLADSPSPFRLEELHLYGAFVDSEDEDQEETEEIVAALTALVRSEKLSTLRHLSLSFNALGVQSLRVLADDNALPQGLRLEINEVNLGPGMRQLVPVLQRLSTRFQFDGLR